MAISISFIFLGFFLKGQVDAFKFTGFFFIFLLGLMLMPMSPVDVEYKTGSVVEVAGDIYTLTDTYTTYEDFTMGFYVAVLGSIGFVSSFMMRSNYEEE
jgi:hypothetical protein